MDRPIISSFFTFQFYQFELNTSVNTKLLYILTRDHGHGVVLSGLHHVVQYSPFSAGGAELHNLVKVVSIISS